VLKIFTRLFSNVVTDIICSNFFGTPTDTINSPDNDLVKNINKIMEAFDPSKNWKIPAFCN